MIKEILDVRTGKREQVGGSSNELKLVATATANWEASTPDHKVLNLDNQLTLNKLYLIEYYNSEWAEGSSTTLLLTQLTKTTTILSWDTDDTAVMCSLVCDNHNAQIILTSSNGNSLYFTEDDYIKVYELPYTLGGTE